MSFQQGTTRERQARIFGLRIVELTSLVLTLSGFLILAGRFEAPKFFPDSAGYLQIADSIRDGSIIERAEAGAPPFIRGVRTPVYPLVLLLGQQLVGGGGGYVLVMHTLIGILTIIITLCVLKNLVPMALSGVILLLLFFDICAPAGSEFFATALTEWTALCISLLYIAAIVSFFEHKSGVRFFLISFIASIGILTRPALIVLFPMIVLLCLVSKKKARNGLLAICGLTPVLLWMTINLHVLNSFSLTTFDGVNLFGVAALIGHAEVTSEDSEDLQYFIQHMNTEKRPRAGAEEQFLAQRIRGLSDREYNHNIYGVALKEVRIASFHPAKINAFMRTYALRTFATYPVRYAQYIWMGLLRSSGGTLLILTGFLLALACIRCGLVGIGWATMSVTIAHVLNLLLSASVQFVIARYVLTTLGPLQAVLAFSAGALAWKAVHRIPNGALCVNRY